MTAVVMGLPALGCRAERAPVTVDTVDSAGVTVVTVGGTSGTRAPWRISRTPIYRTGWSDDEPTFERVWHGAIRADGSVVVVDYQGDRLWEIAGDGTVVGPIGRRGDGPGEFRSPESVILDGDSVLAYDTDHQRFTWFRDGELLSSAPLELGREFGYIAPGILSDGSFLLVPNAWAVREQEPGWLEAPILAARPDFSAADTLAWLPSVWVFDREDRNPLRPFALARSAGSGWIFARNDRAEVRWYELDTLRQVVRWDHPWVEYDEEMWPEIEERMRERLATSPEVSEQRLERLLVEYERDIEGRIPSFGRLLGDSEGNAWIGSYGFSGAESDRYQVVLRDGGWMGTVELPRPMKVLAIRDTLLLAVETDEWDIEAVALYRIEKR